MNITNIRYPQFIGFKHIIEFPLHEDLFLDQWIIPKGTTVKTYQSKNFGVVVLPPNTYDKRGFKVPRRLFRY